MDIPLPDLDDLDAIATRLDRCAEHIAVRAAVTRSATSETWRGRAADLHHERLAEHATDLDDLARRLGGAATAVRHLGATARGRLAALGEVDLTAGPLP